MLLPGLKTANWSDLENKFYERVVKCAPSLTIVWSFVRGVVFVTNGDIRSLKSCSIDLIFAVVSIAALYGCTKINCKPIIKICIMCLIFKHKHLNVFSVSKLSTKITELIDANPFLTKIWKFLQNHCGRTSEVTSVGLLRLGFTATRNAEIFQITTFKFDESNSEHFLDCLENPTKFLKNDSDHEYMKESMMQYVVKCLTEGYQNCERNDICALQVAFRVCMI